MARGNFQKMFLLLVISSSTAFELNCLNSQAANRKPVLPVNEIAAHNAPSASDVALKNIKDVVHRLRTATLDLINDIEQREMVVTGSPDIMQPIAYDDQKPIGWARQMIELGPALPPKKQWLDLDMAHISELLKLLQSDVQALAPGDGQSSASNDYNDLSTIMQDIQAHYQTLSELTKGPRYDNLAIGKAALAIYDDLSKLNKPWKNLLKNKSSS